MIVVGMTSKSQGFYSYILENNHHDVWKIIVLVLALVGIVVLMWVYSSLVGTTDTSVPYYVPTRQVMTDVQREAIMRAPSGTSADTSLTGAQRRALMEKAVKKIPVDTSLTDAQRRQMMRNQ